MNLPARMLGTLAQELFDRGARCDEEHQHDIAKWLEYSGLVIGALAQTFEKHDDEIELDDDPDHP